MLFLRTAALAMALAAPAYGEIVIAHEDHRTSKEQRNLVAGLSSGRIAVLVESKNQQMREAVQIGAIFLIQKVRKEAGLELDVGVMHGTDPDGGDPSDINVIIYANGAPTGFSFKVNDFGKEGDMGLVARTAAKKIWEAHKAYITEDLRPVSN